jgi:hypothetical protein
MEQRLSARSRQAGEADRPAAGPRPEAEEADVATATHAAAAEPFEAPPEGPHASRMPAEVPSDVLRQVDTEVAASDRRPFTPRDDDVGAHAELASRGLAAAD